MTLEKGFIQGWKTLGVWIGLCALVQMTVTLEMWEGLHRHGDLGWQTPLYFLTTWVHIDIGHAIDNALLGFWMLFLWGIYWGFRRGLKWSLLIAFGLFCFEELVHLWKDLPPACGASAWLYAHLPLFFYLIYQNKEWKNPYVMAPLLYFVGVEDLLMPWLEGRLFTASNTFHLMGFLFGALICGLKVSWDKRSLP